MKRIGIICASDDELAPFLELVVDMKVSEKASLKFYEGNLKGISNDIVVIIFYCGVCKVNAAIGTQVLIDFYNVDKVINAGVAGSLSDKVRLFDTVVSVNTVYHDVSDDILTEFHPFMKSIYFEADQELLKLAKEVFKEDKNVCFGTMATGESFIAGSKGYKIIERYKPLSVDMETASIAHVCYVNKIPFIAIRSVTDTQEYPGAEVFEQNCKKSSAISKDKILKLLSNIN